MTFEKAVEYVLSKEEAASHEGHAHPPREEACLRDLPENTQY